VINKRRDCVAVKVCDMNSVAPNKHALALPINSSGLAGGLPPPLPPPKTMARWRRAAATRIPSAASKQDFSSLSHPL